MAQSIRISDHLYFEAQTAAAVNGRSLAQQFEHWARVGQATQELKDAEFIVFNKKVSLRARRDQELVANGEILQDSLRAIGDGLLKKITMDFPSIDFDGLGNDYCKEKN